MLHTLAKNESITERDFAGTKKNASKGHYLSNSINTLGIN